MGVIFLFIALFIHVEATNKCKITQISREINCNGKDLDRVPKLQNPEQYEILDMSDNDLDELFKADFCNFPNLKHLRLDFNEIVYVEDNTFEDLIVLEYLDLSKNILEEVPDEMVIFNKRLLTLDLSGNLFNTRTPCLASPSIEILDLSQSRISRFEEKNIIGLPNLKFLNLSSNNLIALSADIFEIPKRFVSVDLYFNTWGCNCGTVNTFKALMERKFVEIDDRAIACFRGKKIEEMFKRNGQLSKEFNCNRKGNPENIPSLSNKNQENDSLINGIKSLEEILKMEKIYYQELRKEKEVLTSVTSLTMKILIVVIFFVGISLGILISTVMDKRIRRIKKRAIYRSELL